MSAFCTPLSVARARAAAPVLKASPTQPLARARAAKPRRVWAAPLACAQQPADKAGAEEEEPEQLDENAMRAAEIHEVLTGLKDFKTRIIDGALPHLLCSPILPIVCSLYSTCGKDEWRPKLWSLPVSFNSR